MFDINARVNNYKAFCIILFFLLLFSIAINWWLTYQVTVAVDAYHSQLLDVKVLSFASMFVDYVLMADKNVDMERRIALEKSIIEVNDQEIFDQWQKFIRCETIEDASNEARILLHILLKKMK